MAFNSTYRMLLAPLLFLYAMTAWAQSASPEAALRQRVNLFLDEWHDDAANSRLRYFDKIAKDGVYIGTDKSERWTRDDFRAWAKPYFERPTAWAFHATRRNIAFSADRKFIWFDEQLSTDMGPCQASGVIIDTPDGLQIQHYQLSVAIPNDLLDGIAKNIREYEAKAIAH